MRARRRASREGSRRASASPSLALAEARGGRIGVPAGLGVVRQAQVSWLVEILRDCGGERAGGTIDGGGEGAFGGARREVAALRGRWLAVARRDVGGDLKKEGGGEGVHVTCTCQATVCTCM